MNIDPVATAGLVAREVRNGERDGAPTKIVVARRTYATDRADLWSILTDPERIARWFLPVEGDVSVGGRYQVVGNAGGVVERCDEPTSFAVTWEMGPMVSWLTITLTETGDGTTFELEHEAPVDPGMWEQYGPGAVGVGWDLALMGLGLHLESGAPNDGDAVQAWVLSDDGIAFVRAAATDWAEGAVEAGDPDAAARAAAESTIRFYTVPPEA